jgi:hypothetical protein
MATITRTTLSITVETGDHFIIDPLDLPFTLPAYASAALGQLRQRFGEGTFIATHRGVVWVDPDSIITASITHWIPPRS